MHYGDIHTTSSTTTTARIIRSFPAAATTFVTIRTSIASAFNIIAVAMLELIISDDHKYHHHHQIYMPITKQDAQLSQRDRAAGCVIVFAKSRRLELGDNILRTL